MAMLPTNLNKIKAGNKYLLTIYYQTRNYILYKKNMH